MTTYPPAAPALSGAPGAEVVLVALDGAELRGSVQNFNPRLPTFLLHSSGGTQRMSFDSMKTIAFTRVPGKTPAVAFSSNARLVTVRFPDGQTLQGVAENFGGPRSGVFLVPLRDASTDRIYIPSSAIRDVISVHRLGEILGEQKRVTIEMVRDTVDGDASLREESLPRLPPRRRSADRDDDPAPATASEPATAPATAPGAAPAAERARKRGAGASSGASATRIGEILVEQGFITHEELGSALVAAKRQEDKKLGELLIEMGYTSHKMIAIALSIQYNLPFVSLSGYSVDASLRDLLARAEALLWQVFPLGLEDRVLTVAVADPAQTDFREALQRRSAAALVEVVSTPQDIRRMLDALYGVQS